MRNFHLYLSALLMAGCVNQPYVNPYLDGKYAHSSGNTTPTPDQAMYKRGQADGCNSGAAAGGSLSNRMKKDIDLYIKDQYYKSGWDEQFVVCKSEQDRLGRIVDDAVKRSFWY